MIGLLTVPYPCAEGFDVTPVKHLVDAKVHPVSMIGHGRTETGLAIGVGHIVAGDGARGIAAGNIVEVTGQNHRTVDGVKFQAHLAGLQGPCAEGVAEFLKHGVTEACHRGSVR